MDLKELRSEIDKIDDELVKLFAQRMEVSARIADYKKENGLPIFVPEREAAKLQDVAQKAGPELAVYTKVLYDLLFELSRGYQSKHNAARSELFGSIVGAISNTAQMLPKNASVACLAEEHASAEMVGRKFFGQYHLLHFRDHAGILSAVQSGMCRYGILEIQNSTQRIYDLLTEQGLFIVRALRLDSNTQYICVSKTLEIYPGADRSSVRMALSDRPGALYKVLSRLYTLGINAVHLESCPMANKHFQAMFYFDLETSVYSEEFVRLMCELDDLCEEFSYLGSYCEVV